MELDMNEETEPKGWAIVLFQHNRRRRRGWRNHGHCPHCLIDPPPSIPISTGPFLPRIHPCVCGSSQARPPPLVRYSCSCNSSPSPLVFGLAPTASHSPPLLPHFCRSLRFDRIWRATGIACVSHRAALLPKRLKKKPLPLPLLPRVIPTERLPLPLPLPLLLPPQEAHQGFGPGSSPVAVSTTPTSPPLRPSVVLLLPPRPSNVRPLSPVPPPRPSNFSPSRQPLPPRLC